MWPTSNQILIILDPVKNFKHYTKQTKYSAGTMRHLADKITVLLSKTQHQSSFQCFPWSYLYRGISGSLPSVLRVKQHCCSWDFGSFQSWFRINSCNTQTRKKTHVIKLLQQTAFKESEANKNQRQLQNSSSSVSHAFISFLSWPTNLFALSLSLNDFPSVSSQ